MSVLLLDSDGNRLLAKYFQPPAVSRDGGAAAPSAPASLAPLTAKNPYQTLKQQRALEHGVWDKARRASGASRGPRPD